MILLPEGGYDVGGVRLPRPFHVRRLGHFGLNVRNLEADLGFYRDTLGFAVSDIMDFRTRVPDPDRLAALGDTRGIFMRHGTDHHSFVLFDGAVYHGLGKSARMGKEVSANQITLQVGSLQEVVDAAEWLGGQGTALHRSGRDIPGSNWHSYFYDDDGHIIELYYGIEQIGWDGVSKPKFVHAEEFRQSPPLPQRPEFEEVEEALDGGHALGSGYRHRETLPVEHIVEGVRLARPFKIVAIGPVRLFVDDVDAAITFWMERIGLTLTERTRDTAFFRCGAEHHSVAVYAKSLRATLPVAQDDTLMSFGVRLASYAQLRAARDWLTARGVETLELPATLRPGIERAIYARSPHGHLIELHWHMDTAGSERTAPASDWPVTIDPPAALYATEQALGPWA